MDKVTNAGAIFAPEAYARAKMINHGDWFGLLPRRITPSDIDAIFYVGENMDVVDNNGHILFIEFTTRQHEWSEARRGQRLLYENLVKAMAGKACAVLAHINPKPGELINSVKDVLTFQPMFLRDGIVYEEVRQNVDDAWVKFVQTYTH